MLKIIIGWIQQHLVASIVIGIVVVGGAVVTPIVIMNNNQFNDKQQEQKSEEKLILKDNLSFEINSEVSLLSLVSEDNKVKILSEDVGVDTSTLGTKDVTIRYLTGDQEKEYSFKINIVDKTAPTIQFKKELTTNVGSKIDLLKDVVVTDNSKEDIKASVDGNYDFNKDGVYNLKYVAIDSSGNKTEEEFILKVNKKVGTTNNAQNNNNASSNNNANNNANNNDNTNNSEKPKEEEQPKPDPLKKYCDYNVAGYKRNDAGICEDLYPDDHCSYGDPCFGGGSPKQELDMFYDGDVNKYPGGKAQFDIDMENWKKEVVNQAKSICSSMGYGWTNKIDSTWGNCTW